MTNAYLHHKCYAIQGKYKPGSHFEKNLNLIIRSIPMITNFSGGFEKMSVGEGPNFVSLIQQCRGDSYGPKCRSCYATALSGLRMRCRRNKGGIIWYDHCFLEINGIDSSWKIDYDNNFCMSNAKSVSDGKGTFKLVWMNFLDNLTGIAISKRNMDGDEALYAAGERRLATNKVYGMVQCTKDLSTKGCQICVGHIAAQFQNCWGDKQGARVLGRSCNFRYEFYPFVSKAGPRYLVI